VPSLIKVQHRQSDAEYKKEQEKSNLLDTSENTPTVVKRTKSEGELNSLNSQEASMVSEGDKTNSSDNETVESESGQYPNVRGSEGLGVPSVLQTLLITQSDVKTSPLSREDQKNLWAIDEILPFHPFRKGASNNKIKLTKATKTKTANRRTPVVHGQIPDKGKSEATDTSKDENMTMRYYMGKIVDV